MAILYWCVLALMAVGVLGAFVPGLPGSILILVGVITWGIIHDFSGLTVPLIVALLVTIGNMGIDVLATYVGAQQAGASRWGQIGAIVGLVLGIVGLLPALPFGGPLLGIVLGPLLGAIVGEYLYQRNLKRAVRVSLGIVIGTIVGQVIQGLLAIVAVAVFLIATWGTWNDPLDSISLLLLKITHELT